MKPRPRLAITSSAVKSSKARPVIRSGRIVFHPQELYREACEDAEGSRYTVIVWRAVPGLFPTTYTLDDGSPVKLVDDCAFEIIGTGTYITRCR
jgi:hypothetical protein